MTIFIEAPKDSWQRRAVEKTGGNTQLLGCFVLAILGWQHGRKPPRFGKIATIHMDGNVTTNMQSADGRIYPNYKLGPVIDIINNFRGLADELKLNDADRMAMFAELRKWFIDKRAKSEF